MEDPRTPVARSEGVGWSEPPRPLTARGPRLEPRKAAIAAVSFTLVTALLSSLLLVAMAWRTERADRQAEFEALAERSGILARVFASHVERTFRQADVLARLVAGKYLAEGRTLDLRRVVYEGTIPIDVFLQLAVTDEKGMLRGSTLPGWEGLDAADREYVRVHLDRSSAPEFYISRPLNTRESNQPSIQYSRAVIDEQGTLRGVVIVSVAPAHFNSFFAPRDIGGRGDVTLFGTVDRVIRARRAGMDQTIGQTLPADDPTVRALAEGRAGVVSGHRSAIDGVLRTYSYAPVAGLPLGVTVGQDVDASLLQHRNRASQLWTTTLFAIVATLLLAIASMYFARRWARADAGRLHTELSRNRLEDRLSTLVEASPDGVLLVNGGWNVEAVNGAFRRMAGVEDAEVIGLPAVAALQTMSGHRGVELDEDAAMLLKDGPRTAGERVLMKRSIAPALVYEIRSWPVHGEHAHVLSIRDITAQHEMQRMKSDFVTTAAHELRTPMASVLGFSELLLAADLPAAEQREACGAIHRQAMRLTVMLNDFLDLAKVEAHAGLDFRFEDIDFVELVRRTVEEFHYVALDRIVELNEGGPERLPVHGDAAKLEQVIYNLLSNALKYSSPSTPIEVQLDRDLVRNEAIMDVIDRGIGLTAAQLSRVFDGFYRADDSGQTVGSGLGLKLSRRIVEVHGGTVELKSEPGCGTVARVRLPMQRDLVGAPTAMAADV